MASTPGCAALAGLLEVRENLVERYDNAKHIKQGDHGIGLVAGIESDIQAAVSTEIVDGRQATSLRIQDASLGLCIVSALAQPGSGTVSLPPTGRCAEMPPATSTTGKRSAPVIS